MVFLEGSVCYLFRAGEQALCIMGIDFSHQIIAIGFFGG